MGRALSDRSTGQNNGQSSDRTGTAPIVPTDRTGHSARIGRTGLRDPINRGLTGPIALIGPTGIVPTAPTGIDRTIIVQIALNARIDPTGTGRTDRIHIARTVPIALTGTGPAARTPTVRTDRIVQASGTGIATIASFTTAGTATSGDVTGIDATAATGGVMTRASAAGAGRGSVSISRQDTATTACRAPIGTDSMLSASICRMFSGVIR